MGLQTETIGGRVGGVPIWILPNPSGLNAHYKPADFARLYKEARLEAERLALAPDLPAAQVGDELELTADEVPVVDGQDGVTGR